ncbi:MAG: antitoxin [Neisseriaceae bacterium]|nr:antitoxin [Neisseriaceae bacterium]
METTLFMNNHTQSVRLPIDMRFDEKIKKVNIRIVGQDRVLSPISKTWDSFFMANEMVSDDFMQEKEMAFQSEREEL